MERLGFFSERLLHSMAALKLTPKRVAPRAGCSYEFVRRMTRGESLPSRELLTRLSVLFRWNVREIEGLVRADECRRKYGAAFWSVVGIDPKLEPIYILFPYLTPGERQMAVDLLRSYVGRQPRSKE